MKIAAINSVVYGSTGKIAIQILKTNKSKAQNRIYVAASRSNKRIQVDGVETKYIGSILGKFLHLKLNKITGLNGCFSIIPTLRMLCDLKSFNPDIIHLHNLHNCYVNLPLLFRYIKKSKIPVVWTLHDCWSFTAQCPHFTMVKCDKWKTGCHHCPQYRQYPQSYVDRTKSMWKFKKKWFTGVQNMTIVTPSQWLAELVKESFLKDYPVKVINNGIDLSVFKPTKSNLREKYDIADKNIVLGVSFGWGIKKGLDVLIELAERLGEKYQIVLVGTDNEVDKLLPPNIISIHRTHNQVELAEIYTVADVFVNPTREENYPTVNMEAIACGTPVVTFRTGGSPEIIAEGCGCIVDCDNISAMEMKIKSICESKPYSKKDCLVHSKSFDLTSHFNEYLQIYKSCLAKGANRE